MVMYDNKFQTRPIKLNKTFAIDFSVPCFYVRSSRLGAYCNEHPSWFHMYCGNGCRVLPVPTSPSRFGAFETKMTAHHCRRSISTTLRNNRVVNV